jgi:hypothetical protein
MPRYHVTIRVIQEYSYEMYARDQAWDEHAATIGALDDYTEIYSYEEVDPAETLKPQNPKTLRITNQ